MKAQQGAISNWWPEIDVEIEETAKSLSGYQVIQAKIILVNTQKFFPREQRSLSLCKTLDEQLLFFVIYENMLYQILNTFH